MADLSQIAFKNKLGKRGVYIDYDVSDFEVDLKNMDIQF